MERNQIASTDEKNGILRYFWLALGGISFLLGTAGIVLPLVPTVPFYLLTAFSFAKGSEKFYRWFLDSSFYKNHLADYKRDRSMTWKAKLRILVMVTLVMAAGVYAMQHMPIVKWAMVGVWCIHLIVFIFLIKTRKVSAG